MGSMFCNFVTPDTGCDPDTRPMQNQEKFEARQTDAGSALLFSIDAGGALCLTREVAACGWQQLDLSSAQIRRDLAHGRCTDFASARSVPVPGRPGAIHLAMVVNDGRHDHLYLSLSNPASDTAWSAAPVWTACPFNAGPAPARLKIAGVQIGEANDGLFVVVDLAGHAGAAGDTSPLRSRYVIDASQAGLPRWVPHNVPVDAAAAIYASCLGRSRGGWNVDGLYLACRLGDTPQLIYAPLYHPFSPSMPVMPRRLALPDDLAAGTIATCRNLDNTASLFATAAGALYFFAATNQFDGAQALRLVADPLFEDMRMLFAFSAGGRFTVWGLNGAGQVVTTSADQVIADDPASWHPPRVILSGVDAIAPCLDRGHPAGSFFAQTANRMARLARSSTADTWTSQDIVFQENLKRKV